MSTPTNVNCPRCGNVLPARAPEGLCPRCLGALNLLDDTALTGTPAAAAHPPLTPAELAPHFPQLEILECLGRGGMGVVYKARQKTLNRLVALKLLAPERVTDPGFAERFTREAQALARLSHPNIVTIHDFGTTRAGDFQSPPAAPSTSAPGDSPPTSPPQTLGPRHQTPFYFLLMEFVDGVNLRQAMKAGRFTPEQALAVVPPVCEALQYAHDHGIVHRDIKPENLLLDKNGRVKIADFGIAKMLNRDGDTLVPDAFSPTTELGDKSVPATFASVAGTPQYMAPEQKAHRVTDHRADIYSLGVVLYELLTGEMPADKLQPPSRKVQIDVRLDEIVLRALETKPELRFQTAGEFRTQLVTFEREDRAKKREDREERIEKSNQPPSLSSILSPLSSPQPLLKTANAYLSTPEWLASARGRFWVYSGKGTLVLTRDQLAFTDEKTGATTSIPLAAICDVSLGNYPWLAKPAPLHYLSVTWVENGLTRCRYFTPNRGWFMPVWETNPIVLGWHQALRAAVTAATGKAPAETPAPPHRPTMPDLVWMGLLFGLPMWVIGAVFLHLQQKMAGDVTAPFWRSSLVLALIGIVFVAPLLALFFLARRSSQPASRLPHAPGEPSGAASPKLVWLIVPVLFATGLRLLLSLSGGGGFVPGAPELVNLAVLGGLGLWHWLRREAPPAPPGTPNAGQLSTPPAGSQAPRAVWGQLVGALFGITFTSPLAFKLVNLSALGFLGFLGFVGLSEIDGLRWCLGFFGFSGFFGLIGVASIVETAHRRKANARMATDGHVANGRSVLPNSPDEPTGVASPQPATSVRPVSRLLGLGLLLAGVGLAGLLFFEESRAHNARFFMLTGEIPKLQQQWSAA